MKWCNASGGGVDPGNVKIVHPVPRSFKKLNPNAKPFESVNLELPSCHPPTFGRPLNPEARPFRVMSNGESVAEPIGLPLENNFYRLTEKVNNWIRACDEIFSRTSRWPMYEESTSHSVSDNQNSYHPIGHQHCSARSRGVRHLEGSFANDNFPAEEYEPIYGSENLLNIIHQQSKELRIFQDSLLRQVEKIDRRIDEMNTRLRVVEELRSYAAHDLYCDARHVRREDSMIGKTLMRDEVWPFTDHRLRGQSPFHIPGSVAQDSHPPLNNSTLNNQVLPGTRQNNFYDNFRRQGDDINSQQNLLTVPKNIPGSRTGVRQSNGNWNASSNYRESAGSGDSSAGNFLHRRSGISKGAEFVENIGTKLRNHEKELPQHHFQRNEELQSQSPIGHIFNASGTPGNEDVDVGSTVALISLFFDRNAASPVYLHHLFRKLVEVRSEPERFKTLEALTSVLSESTSPSAFSNFMSPANRNFIIDAPVRRRVVDIACAALEGTRPVCADVTGTHSSPSVWQSPYLRSVIPSKIHSAGGKVRSVGIDCGHRNTKTKATHSPSFVTEGDGLNAGFLETNNNFSFRNSHAENPQEPQHAATASTREKNRLANVEEQVLKEADVASPAIPFEVSDDELQHDENSVEESTVEENTLEENTIEEEQN